jgi:hypothetical protein
MGQRFVRLGEVAVEIERGRRGASARDLLAQRDDVPMHHLLDLLTDLRPVAEEVEGAGD